MLADAAGPPVDAPGLDVPDDHPAARLVAAGSHPDLMRLERLARGRRHRARPLDQRRPGPRPPAPVRHHPLDVAVARGRDRCDRRSRARAAPTPCSRISRSRRRTPSSCWSAMRPERLLPTIRSRCRLLRFSPLGDDAMTSALRAALPDADAGGDRGAGRGSARARPGRAIAWRGLDVEALDRAMDALVASGDPANAGRAALAQSLALKSAQPRYEAFLARAPARIAAEARRRQRARARRGAQALGARHRPRRQRPAPLARPAKHGVRAGRHARRAGAGRGEGRGLSPLSPPQPR